MHHFIYGVVIVNKYRSSVMRCTGCEDEGCVMCRFLVHEERSQKVLLHVIETLDHKLDEREKLFDMAIAALINEIANRCY